MKTKGQRKACDTRMLRKVEKKKLARDVYSEAEVTKDKSIGRVWRRNYGGGVVS